MMACVAVAVTISPGAREAIEVLEGSSKTIPGSRSSILTSVRVTLPVFSTVMV